MEREAAEDGLPSIFSFLSRDSPDRGYPSDITSMELDGGDEEEHQEELQVMGVGAEEERPAANHWDEVSMVGE